MRTQVGGLVSTLEPLSVLIKEWSLLAVPAVRSSQRAKWPGLSQRDGEGAERRNEEMFWQHGP